mgnify:CR=1 FL=1
MIDLEYEDLYFPNTKVIRNLLESLNYTIIPLSDRERREPIKCKSICFGDWVQHLERLKRTNSLYYCMDKPTLTEEQTIFVFDILHLCPDYQTFKEALEQYINNNP